MKTLHKHLAITALGAALMPPAWAVNLTASSDAPTVSLDDTDIAGTSEWSIKGSQRSNSQVDFEIQDVAHGTTVVRLRDTSANAFSMFVNADGDVSFAEDSVFIDRSSDRVGIGTILPIEELHIDSTAPAIRLDDTSPGAGRADLGVSNNRFYIQGNDDQNVVNVDTDAPSNFLNVVTGGGVGIGTTNPVGTLHVVGATTIDGTFSVLSSEAAKHEMEPVSGEAILRRLDALDLFTWRYIDDPRQARHVGPTAEDFHALFGVGTDPQHLSPMDAAGVALASAQELRRVVRDQQLEIAELRDQRDDLALRLSAIEEKLAGPGVEGATFPVR